MKLSSFSVINYRSITTARKIQTRNMTVLVGKNNEGKSNILRALTLAMDVMKMYASDPRALRFSPRYFRGRYDWKRDYPLALQERNPNGFSSIDLDFELTNNEIAAIRGLTGIRLTSNIPVRVSINDTTVKIDIPKRGTAAFSDVEKKQRIIEYVCFRIDFNFIPAIRTENDALKVIDELIDGQLSVLASNPEYISAKETIEHLQQSALDNISEQLVAPLRDFLPSVRDVQIHLPQEQRRHLARYNAEIIVDDGTPTPIQQKGDGIKSLTALALLNISSRADRVSVIAIEEPESHLHPESARQLYNTIATLAENHQVVLTTHSPLFVNRTNLKDMLSIERMASEHPENITKKFIDEQISRGRYWYRTYCKNTLKEYTQKTYEQRIYKQIIPNLGHYPLNKITAGMLERFYAELKTDGRLVRREQNGNGLSDSVIRSIHAHCRAALQKAVDEGLISKDPATNCKLPPKRYAEIKILLPEEMQKLLYQAQIEGFYEMFLLDLSTGLRRGELLGLKWDDIDFDEGTLAVKRQVRFEKGKLKISSPKTKASERTIVLPPPIIEMLKEYRTKINSMWLFPSPVKSEDVPRDPTACRKRLSQILERADCKHVPFHALRHTFASHAFHYGMDVKTLASTIGHESVETTLNVYAHTSEKMKQDAADRIDDTLGTATGEKFALCDEKGKDEQLLENSSEQATRTIFEPYKPKYRRRGTGSVHQISENTWEGRYTPTVNGKRVAQNVYAHTEQECEQKLSELIHEMKAELGITD